MQFTGKERDAESGLDYFGARYFSGAQGRFTSPDRPFADQHPADPQSWNLYSYVRNNPLRYTDPTGHECGGSSVGQVVQSCVVQPVIGVAKEAANQTVVPAANLVNGVIDPAIAFTGFQFGQMEPFTPANSDQAGGAEVLQQTEIFFGLGLGTTALAPTLSETGTAEQTFQQGSFSISDWTGYPAGVPKPAEGTTFRLLEGSEYQAARTEANQANRMIRLKDPASYQNMQIHEITPVKFGGSPTALENKIALPTSVHQQQVTPWWNGLLRDLTHGIF